MKTEMFFVHLQSNEDIKTVTPLSLRQAGGKKGFHIWSPKDYAGVELGGNTNVIDSHQVSAASPQLWVYQWIHATLSVLDSPLTSLIGYFPLRWWPISLLGHFNHQEILLCFLCNSSWTYSLIFGLNFAPPADPSSVHIQQTASLHRFLMWHHICSPYPLNLEYANPFYILKIQEHMIIPLTWDMSIISLVV